MANTTQSLWDTSTQEVHGGQTWRSLGESLVADFSVTTNALGAPDSAMKASAAALADIHHYPPADCGAARHALASFTQWPADQILLGNGASEFIDMVMRAVPGNGPCRTGPFRAAYMEYDRAARAAGREVISVMRGGAGDREAWNASGHQAAITIIIRPNSPTGDVLDLDDLEAIIRDTNGLVVIDESFIVFQGPQWRQHSALQLIDRYPDQLLVLASWTKLWSCPGLRLGSISASTEWIHKLKRLQTPWSCSTVAQAFFEAASNDKEYLSQTWSTLPDWKAQSEKRLRMLGWIVNEDSPRWVPWIFFDCGDAEIADRAAAVAHKAGCPVRLCASFGEPSCIRMGVRSPDAQDVLFAAWDKAFLNSTSSGEPMKAIVSNGVDSGLGTQELPVPIAENTTVH